MKPRPSQDTAHYPAPYMATPPLGPAHKEALCCHASSQTCPSQAHLCVAGGQKDAQDEGPKQGAADDAHDGEGALRWGAGLAASIYPSQTVFLCVLGGQRLQGR